ncbi:MAG: Rieske (2Fe-2S) protein [Alphaproteobacteria bacterium]
MTGAAAARRKVLCRLDDIPMPGAKGFTLGDGADALDIFVVRDASGVYAYVNDCPHTGGPLDWNPDVFLTLDKRHIQCATHGAVFGIADGRCIHGPCAGENLASVTVAVVDGAIVLTG